MGRSANQRQPIRASWPIVLAAGNPLSPNHSVNRLGSTQRPDRCLGGWGELPQPYPACDCCGALNHGLGRSLRPRCGIIDTMDDYSPQLDDRRRSAADMALEIAVALLIAVRTLHGPAWRRCLAPAPRDYRGRIFRLLAG
jgi:hypothetical protein